MKKRVPLRFLKSDSDKSRLADTSVRFRVEHIFTALVAIAVGSAIASVAFVIELWMGRGNYQVNGHKSQHSVGSGDVIIPATTL